MKACVLEAVNRLVFKDVPTPSPREGEVLLKIRACGICSSDIARVKQTGTYHFPTIPGHEFCGEIVAVGQMVSSSLIGKRAVVFPLLPCGKCFSCKEEHYAQCSHYNYFGSRCDGGFAEYIAVPFWNIQIFNDSIPFTTAALCEPAAVALHAVKLCSIQKSTTICVVGTGTIGILCGLWVRQRGSRVIFVSRNEQKSQFLDSLGFKDIISEQHAVTAIQELTNGLGADVALECVGTNTSLETAINMLCQRGTLILTGNPSGDMLIRQKVYWKILRSELTVKGSWNAVYGSRDNDWKEVLTHLESLKEPFAKLVTHSFSLKDYISAFNVLCIKDIFSIKVVLKNEG